nr:MAG TPA: 30S ribosomal protein S2 [Caudoviricetes sp.]
MFRLASRGAINTILPRKNIICRENFVEITRFFLFSFPI